MSHGLSVCQVRVITGQEYVSNILDMCSKVIQLICLIFFKSGFQIRSIIFVYQCEVDRLYLYRFIVFVKLFKSEFDSFFQMLFRQFDTTEWININFTICIRLYDSVYTRTKTRLCSFMVNVANVLTHAQDRVCNQILVWNH